MEWRTALIRAGVVPLERSGSRVDAFQATPSDWNTEITRQLSLLPRLSLNLGSPNNENLAQLSLMTSLIPFHSKSERRTVYKHLNASF